MLLSARMLSHVADVNTFDYTDSAKWTLGDTVDVYLQLIDASIDPPERGFSPSGRRYIPAVGATLQVQINSIDSTKTYTKTATQPFNQDPSIWKITIASTDKVVGTRDLILVLTQSSVVTKGRVKAAISVDNTQDSF